MLHRPRPAPYPRPRVFLHTAAAAGSNLAGCQDLLLGTYIYSLDHSFEPLTTTVSFSGTQKSIAASDAIHVNLAAIAPACTVLALEGASAGRMGHDASRAALAQPVHSNFWYSTNPFVANSAAAVALASALPPRVFSIKPR